MKLEDTRSILAAAHDAGPRTMLVTSAPAMIAGGIGNLLLTPSEALLAEHRMIEKPPNGLGDLTAAVLLARLLAGQPVAKALQSTTAAVYRNPCAHGQARRRRADSSRQTRTACRTPWPWCSFAT